MSGEQVARGTRGPGRDGWLGWDGEGTHAAAADGPGQEHATGTTGPWLRHDPDAQDVPATDPAHLPAVQDPTHRDAPVDTEQLPVRGDTHDDPDDGPHDDHDDPDDDEPTSGLAVLGAAVKEFVIVIGMALVLSFVVKTWLLQAFYIPSGSMENTLQVNDRVIVSKLTPGPIDLKRGDIIVFGDPGNWVEAPVEQQHGKAATALRDALTFVGLLPDNAENHLIKRVIGLPGDHVVCCDAGGRLTVNGAPVKEPYLKAGVAPSDQDFDVTVPRGRVWVMGDNRSGSADSRAHDGPENDGTRGSVDERLIVGRAVVLVWPLDHFTWLSNPGATFRNVPEPSKDGGKQPSSGPTTGGGDVTGDGG